MGLITEMIKKIFTEPDKIINNMLENEKKKKEIIDMQYEKLKKEQEKK